jgi:predicted ATPase
MSHFLTAIQINKIFHLENIHIPIDKDEKKHLLITGKNGSGKTSLLLALKEFLFKTKNRSDSSLLEINNKLASKRNYIEKLRLTKSNKNQIDQAKYDLDNLILKYQHDFGKIISEYKDLNKMCRLIKSGEFITAYYEANRKIKMAVPRNPEKPYLQESYTIDDNKQSEFLKFLVDLKVQEALARNEGDLSYADEIKVWFTDFNGLLNQLFDGEQVQLIFNFKDYSFIIDQDGRQFGFNELSDGYSAIIDIVADLILKMQTSGSVTRAFQKEGIVLIDEIETHLHLELQKTIMPFLTKVFPNIQFIVTTHSPFVLSSLSNAVAYDLEKREALTDLNEYSYEALAEGYFEVSSESSYLDSKIKRFEQLLKTKDADSAILQELRQLDEELGALDQNLTPDHIRAQYMQLKLKHLSK